MNKKTIIIVIAGIAAIGAVWMEINSKERQMKPSSQGMQGEAQFANMVDEIGHQIICPDSACAAQGIFIAHSGCETSTMMRQQIGMMLSRGLTREGVMAHLKMIGLIPGDPGLPEGHPPMGGAMEGTGAMPPGHPDTTAAPALPPGHPPITD